MLGFLILLFIVLPLTELFLLFKLADHIGAEYTFALVIFTGILGGWLARRQGWQVYAKIQADLAAAKIPKESLMDGGMILVAGAFLLTPGVMTDVFGFSLLIPPCRTIYRKLIGRWMKDRFQIQTFGGPMPGQRPNDANTVDSPGWQPGSPDDIIDSHVIEGPDND